MRYKHTQKNRECVSKATQKPKAVIKLPAGGAPLRSRRGQGDGVSPLGSKSLFSQSLPLSNISQKISPVSADTGEILASVNAEDAAGAAGNNGGKGFCQG